MVSETLRKCLNFTSLVPRQTRLLNAPYKDPLQNLLVHLSVARPILLNLLKQTVLQCEGVVLAIQISHLQGNREQIYTVSGF